MELMKPTVHLNGTSRQYLENVYSTAAAMMRAAIKSVEETEPHSRDYYIQGENAYAEAAKQHKARLEKLESVRSELYTILIQI